MRFVRLAVEAQGRTLEVNFHPRFTVVTGVGSATRESMIHELLSGLCTHRSGTHLELATDAGRTLVVFRPSDAFHRVIDTANGSDVTAEFTTSGGTVDLLEVLGMTATSTRRWSRIGPNDLVASTQNQDLIGRLGRIDQRSLWSDAQRVQIARRAVSDREETAAVEDTALTERIDHNYHAQDAARDQADRTRLIAIGVATACLLAAALLATTSSGAAAVAVAVAIAATIVAFVFRARVAYFARQLDQALSESGSDSYLGYQLDRIDGYIHSEHQRRHQAAVKADVDDALKRWAETAGDVDVDWALEHRPAIEAAASLEQGNDRDFTGGLSLVPRHAHDEAPELIETLLSRVAKNKELGDRGESFPLLLDEPFGVINPAIRPALLEALLSQAGTPQIVLLTNSDDVIAWARREEPSGALSVVGPGSGAENPQNEADELEGQPG